VIEVCGCSSVGYVHSLNCWRRMERDMAKEKREAWERDVEKMRQILAAQGYSLFV